MKKLFLLSITVLYFATACNNNHFITDRTYREKVELQFERQKELAKNRSVQLFGVFDKKLTTREAEALKFIYAFSSLSDLADYNGDFFLHNIRTSFAARDSFRWGKTVPENLFRHFVLPVRVNNENLDSSRWVFFSELKDRVKNLAMKDAVLEVNHWCHEKVTYRGSDGRTSSPLASVKTAWGRCGEESTFTVAALRSVCIPARQCYTPRWAHSDDNHAWVEVWVDGKWHFIGACEPDADLDLAWFTKPAKRAMLVNTTVFGDYEGPEEILQKDPLFTKINVLANYAPVKKVTVRVTDGGNHELDSASVEFQLYNYAEFYPLFKTVTDQKGLCSFTTGFGDLLVWAAKDGKYGFQKLDVRKTDTITLKLDHAPGQTFNVEFDLIPPAETDLSAEVLDSAKAVNGRRLAFEDGLRGSYEATFIDSLKSARFARLVNLNPDTTWMYLHRSYGNWREITAFIAQVPAGKKAMIFPLLENLSEKDLRDIDTAVLFDNLNNSGKFRQTAGVMNDFYTYILTPRVDNEFLKPFRKLFQENFDNGFITKSRENPGLIADWIRSNITRNNTANYSRAPLTPAGVYELKVADDHSADICFVAICRSFGIPARLDPATRVPQYMSGKGWQDVFLYDAKQEAGKKGVVILTNPASNKLKPEYTIHYTLETYHQGFFRTLDYEGSPLVRNYPCTLDIPVGTCLMVTGSRLTNGTVLANLNVFEVNGSENSSHSVALRTSQLPLPVYGTISQAVFGKRKEVSRIIVWIEPDKEPTKHLLADLRQKKQEIDKWAGEFIMVFRTGNEMNSFMKKEAPSLPGNISFSEQAEFPLKPSDLPLGKNELRNLPIVVFISMGGVINYQATGYRIGTVGELLTMMK